MGSGHRTKQIKRMGEEEIIHHLRPVVSSYNNEALRKSTTRSSSATFGHPLAVV
jgi:hypothetical protein